MQIIELKLKLAQLARNTRSDSEVVGANLDLGEVKAKLPITSHQADIVMFLTLWERCLQLNNALQYKTINFSRALK